jgi:hypothetical protein
MRRSSIPFVSFLVGIALAIVGCDSKPIDAEGSAGAAATNPCSGALRQSLSLVDAVSTATVTLLSDNGSELVVYVDASVGGINGQDDFPWVYISLATGAGVAVGDIDALDSLDWDLALKRNIIRTNGGDSGPGQGGALRVALAWEDVDASTLGTRPVPVEDWFDDECNLTLSADANELITTYSGWSQYDLQTHVLTPVDVVYLTQGADGSLYKVAILDYYSNPNGTQGNTAGRYQLRIAPLP